MILYRARAKNERETRVSPREIENGEGNAPHVRVRGRWFTSEIADAIDWGHTNLDPMNADPMMPDQLRTWEVVSIDIPDAVADSLRVATTPHTADGLSPIDFADRPETEYVVQTFRVVDAVAIDLRAAMRARLPKAA